MAIDVQNIKEELISSFSSIIVDIRVLYSNELRVNLVDGSFIKFWFSLKLKNRYSYHWERKHIDGKIYRHDNSPHIRWQYIPTYPKHFHNETEENVESSYISDIPEIAVVEMLRFVEQMLRDIAHENE